MTFADRLKEVRKEAGLTQTELANELGISTGSVAMWETGKRNPDYEMLNKISEFFNKKIDYVLGFSEDSSPRNPKGGSKSSVINIEVEESQANVLKQYLRLDSYGKMSVEELIKREAVRCKEQGTEVTGRSKKK